MMRKGKEGEFRSNLHRGGTASLVKITPEERSTAVRSAKVMGLNVAGVDLLRSAEKRQARANSHARQGLKKRGAVTAPLVDHKLSYPSLPTDRSGPPPISGLFRFQRARRIRHHRSLRNLRNH
jgi:hypothetical protein